MEERFSVEEDFEELLVVREEEEVKNDFFGARFLVPNTRKGVMKEKRRLATFQKKSSSTNSQSSSSSSSSSRSSSSFSSSLASSPAASSSSSSYEAPTIWGQQSLIRQNTTPQTIPYSAVDPTMTPQFLRALRPPPSFSMLASEMRSTSTSSLPAIDLQTNPFLPRSHLAALDTDCSTEDWLFDQRTSTRHDQFIIDDPNDVTGGIRNHRPHIHTSKDPDADTDAEAHSETEAVDIVENEKEDKDSDDDDESCSIVETPPQTPTSVIFSQVSTAHRNISEKDKFIGNGMEGEGDDEEME